MSPLPAAVKQILEECHCNFDRRGELPAYFKGKIYKVIDDCFGSNPQRNRSGGAPAAHHQASFGGQDLRVFAWEPKTSTQFW
jgi:hypothetical protein